MGDALVKDPVVLGQDLDDVRAGGSEFVVDLGGRGEEGLAPVRGHVEGVEGEDVAEVCVEGLGGGVSVSDNRWLDSTVSE